MRARARRGLSSLGTKYLMALTGLALIGFVLVHMAGNLLIFAGRGALNSYAHHLEELGVLLWIARIVLLAIFVLHISLGIRLWIQNREARPNRYYCERALTASWASRHMMLTGLVILAFVVYHLMHFTFGIIDPANSKRTLSPVPLGEESKKFPIYGTSPRTTSLTEDPNKKIYSGPLVPDLESNVVASFRQRIYGVPWIAVSYIIAQLILGLHLWHGGSSWLQSLGLNRRRPGWLVNLIGPILALIVVVGNCSIPVAICWLRYIPS